jgi:hypothetical protein
MANPESGFSRISKVMQPYHPHCHVKHWLMQRPLTASLSGDRSTPDQNFSWLLIYP